MLKDRAAHRDSGVGGRAPESSRDGDPTTGRTLHCSERKETRMAAVSRRDFLKAAGAIGAGAAAGIGFPEIGRAHV